MAVTLPTVSPGLVVRIKYASYLFFALLFCLIMRGAMGRLMSDISYLGKGCQSIINHEQQSSSDSSRHAAQALNSAAEQAAQAAALLQGLAKQAASICFENIAVYRISFALFIFYVVHFFSVSDLTCCVDDKSRAELQTSFFTGRTVLLFFLNIAVFWIPTDFYVVYAYISVVVSAVFLLIQIALVVDFSYQWNEEWSSRSEENSKWMYYMGAVTAVMAFVGGGLTVNNILTFIPHEDCNLHGFLITANVLGAAVYTGVAVWVPHGSILPSSIIFAYTAFLTTSALRMSTDPHCNADFVPGTVGGQSMGMMLGSAIIAAITLGYSTLSISGKYDAMIVSDPADPADGAAEEAAGNAPAPAAINAAPDGADDDGEGTAHHPRGTAYGHLPAYMYFYGIMAMGAMYLAMLGTNWQVSGGSHDMVSVHDMATTTTGSQLAFWVKLSTCWITVIAYLWSLLAPYFCCRHRDYGYDVAGFGGW